MAINGTDTNWENEAFTKGFLSDITSSVPNWCLALFLITIPDSGSNLEMDKSQNNTVEIDCKHLAEDVETWASLPYYKEKGLSPFQKGLLEIRKEIKESGVKLLNWNEIDKELEENRG